MGCQCCSGDVDHTDLVARNRDEGFPEPYQPVSGTLSYNVSLSLSHGVNSVPSAASSGPPSQKGLDACKEMEDCQSPASTGLPGASNDETNQQESSEDEVGQKHSELLAAVSEAAKDQEWCVAESIILAALNPLTLDAQKEFWSRIAADPVVKDVISHSEILWDARRTLAASAVSSDPKDKAAALGYAGWTMLPPVVVDMAPYFPGAPPDFFTKVDTSATMMWRLDGETLCIKVLGDAPAEHPTLAKSFPVALVSMLSEVDLNKFVPIFTAQPYFLAKPTREFSTWVEQSKIRFILSEIAILQMTRMFSSDGAAVLVTEKILDENDERMKNVHIPKGYVVRPGRDKIYTVLGFSEEHFTYVTTALIPLPGGAKIPGWILNTLLSWLFPSIVRKIFHEIGTIFTNDDYTTRHAQDETGLYARVRKAEVDGRNRDCSPGNLHVDSFAFGLLAERVASFK